jgi:hypothetical protein
MNETFNINIDGTMSINNIFGTDSLFFPNAAEVLPQNTFDSKPRGYINELFERYAFGKDSNEVSSFLEKNYFLIPIVLEADGEIKKYFPYIDAEDLKLEKFFNPETQEEKLFITIMVELTPEEALRRLDELKNNWWRSNIKKTQWKLRIDVGFK